MFCFNKKTNSVYLLGICFGNKASLLQIIHLFPLRIVIIKLHALCSIIHGHGHLIDSGNMFLPARLCVHLWHYVCSILQPLYLFITARSVLQNSLCVHFWKYVSPIIFMHSFLEIWFFNQWSADNCPLDNS